MSFIRHASRNTVAHCLSAMLLLLAGVITARFLGPEGRGLYAVFFTTAGLMSQMLYFGLSEANVYYMKREKRSCDEIFGNSVLFMIGQGVLMACILAIFHKPIGVFFSDSSIVLILCLLWGTAFSQAAKEVYSGFLLGRHLFTLYALNTFIIAFGVFAAAFAAYWFPDNAEIVISIRVIVFIAIALLFFIIMLWVTKPRFRISLSLSKCQLVFGLKNYLQNILGSLNLRFYLLLLSLMMGHSAAGLFSVAFLLVEPSACCRAVGPVLLAYLANEHDEIAHKQMTAKSCRMILALVTLGAIFYIPLVPYLLYYVFGAAYLEALSAVYIMIFAGLVGIVFQVLTRYFISSNQQKYMIIASAIALVIAFSIAVVLIPSMGVLGAAYAYLSSTATASIIAGFYYWQLSRAPVMDLLMLQKEDFSDFYKLRAKIITKFKYDKARA